eukprot:scaffold5321_cov366-Prasinococcus_capsulatus_cf.AAC.12
MAISAPDACSSARPRGMLTVTWLHQGGERDTATPRRETAGARAVRGRGGRIGRPYADATQHGLHNRCDHESEPLNGVPAQAGCFRPWPLLRSGPVGDDCGCPCAVNTADRDQ